MLRKRNWWMLIIPAIILAGLMVLLAGCGTDTEDRSVWLDGDTIRLPDGREVICVYYKGVTCDWDHPVSNIDYPLEDEQ